jgi:PAS domain S-box-containing protein
MSEKPTRDDLEQRIRKLEEELAGIRYVEAALRQSETLFRNLFEQHAAVKLIIDPDNGNIIDANNMAAEFYGWTREQLRKMKIQDINILSPEQIKMEMEKARTLTRINFEFQHRRADGSIRDVEVFASRIDTEGKELIHSIVHDITDRKTAEKELANKRQRLAYILEGTNVGTWEWNVQTGETIFNERWAEIIGYSLEEIKPLSIETWKKFSHPDDMKVSNDLLERHFKKESPYYECEVRMRHRDGSWVWVLDRGKVATWTQDGKPLIMSGTHQDITNRKRAEEELEKERSRLRKALDEVRTLRGILPICSNCKKIRDDKGYWNQIESYIRDHSEADFSHSLCPECAKKLYPELYDK